ncbi:MAG: hypothetical protein HQL88_04270 [Magnetococcales bacterium]|nr:hypothetical protein [Magnetococcales bacterium]
MYTSIRILAALKSLPILWMALLLAGCSSHSPLDGKEGLWQNHGGRDFVSPALSGSAIQKIAVLPFLNWTDHPNADEITARLTVTELHHHTLFKSIDLVSQVEESKMAAAGSKGQQPNRADLQEMGKRLGVDAVLTGAVSEFAYQHGLREEPAVGLSLRLVRVTDGELLWTSSHSEIGAGWFRRDSLNLTAQRVIARMVGELVRRRLP